MGWVKTAEELRSEIIMERNEQKNKRKRTIALMFFFFIALFIVLWNNTPTRLGEHVFIERDLKNHKQTIHTNSSCSKIRIGYVVNETSFYTYTPYLDEFCSKCFYESDAIKLTKGENRFSNTKALGL
ncbi:MAG TPA: hypothetical protein DDW28_00115 [Prevotella sp.]|nr:hypothetical protein [uncultured Prevotella sp.]HBF04576.1 hypothetical protein [Candidatus Segatella violae]